jgi:hypothetical protein
MYTVAIDRSLIMWEDPIVEEIHKIREEIAKKFNHDLHAICEDARMKQGKSGHVVVSFQSDKSSQIIEKSI